MKKKFEISASLICADPLNLEKTIIEIEKSNIDYIHIDIMDGVFVPRYGLYPEILFSIKKITKIPMDVHMMVQNPEPYIEIFAKAGANIFYVHVENNNNLHRTLKLIEKSGMKVGVILNLATPLSVLDYILEDIEYIMLMGINPGIVGHKIIPQIYRKISDVKKKIEGTNIKIMIDGGVTPETSPNMIKAGANILVCGTSSIFKPHEGTLEETTKKYINYVNKELENN